jgi:hypothetical protein
MRIPLSNWPILHTSAAAESNSRADTKLIRQRSDRTDDEGRQLWEVQ